VRIKTKEVVTLAFQEAWSDSPDKSNKTELIKLVKDGHFMIRVRIPSVQSSSEPAHDHSKIACIVKARICGDV